VFLREILCTARDEQDLIAEYGRHRESMAAEAVAADVDAEEGARFFDAEHSAFVRSLKDWISEKNPDLDPQAVHDAAMAAASATNTRTPIPAGFQMPGEPKHDSLASDPVVAAVTAAAAAKRVSVMSSAGSSWAGIRQVEEERSDSGDDAARARATVNL
jgi:hypothetical protein